LFSITLNWYSKGQSYPAAEPVIENNYASIKFSQNKVKIPAGKSATITLSFSEPKKSNASNFPIYSGYVVATPEKGNVPVNVPYTGLKGDVSKVPIIDTDLGFPGLALRNSTDGINDIPKDFVFDLSKDKPVVQTRLGSHTPSFSVRVFDSKKDFKGFLDSDVSGSAYSPWSGRQKNVDDHGNLVFTTWTWNGKVLPSTNATASVALPSGTYSLVVASQKKLTKGAYPNDFEIFALGDVNIKV
ncbi:hypothetical protein BGZ76_006134, partial [Entomortierella beljakovae]